MYYAVAMDLSGCLKKAVTKLERAGIGTARLDALVLLEDVTGRDRAWLLAHMETEILSSQLATLENLISRRARHEPLAYVRGRTEFYGRDFVITPAVLEPRPESETMIDCLKDLCHNVLPAGSEWRVADVGAGSGALGITAALELPECSIELIEIDPQAAKVAKMNVDKFTLDIKVQISDLFERARQNYDILLCNLPYVPDDYSINLAASHEPRIAIFGGPDGLDVYRRLFEQLRDEIKSPLYLLSEAMPPQHNALADIASQSGYTLQKTDDFIQVFAGST
jgi:release factor glutamine methyltransferase